MFIIPLDVSSLFLLQLGCVVNMSSRWKKLSLRVWIRVMDSMGQDEVQASAEKLLNGENPMFHLSWQHNICKDKKMLIKKLKWIFEMKHMITYFQGFAYPLKLSWFILKMCSKLPRTMELSSLLKAASIWGPFRIRTWKASTRWFERRVRYRFNKVLPLVNATFVKAAFVNAAFVNATLVVLHLWFVIDTMFKTSLFWSLHFLTLMISY